MRHLAAALFLFASSPADASPPAQLLGHVTEARTHRDLPQVQVTITGKDQPPIRVETDDHGIYRVTLPDGGAYTVTFDLGDMHGERIVTVDRGKAVAFDAAFKLEGEVIEVQDAVPPPVPAQPVDRKLLLPKYSDSAIVHDRWVRAWILLDIDEQGVVRRAKWLNRPGYDLETIALDRVFGMRFTPAQDAHGNAVRTQLAWGIDWPSYGWLMATEGNPYRIPAWYRNIGCKGQAPLNLKSIHPTLRDCSSPDWSRAAVEPWIDRR